MLASLAARVFGGQVIEIGPWPGRLRRVWNRRARPEGRGDDVLLALLYKSGDISRLRNSPAFRDPRYRAVVAWIVDSFHELSWVGQADFRGVDLICITRSNEYGYYRRAFGDRILALHWGADVLGCRFDPGPRALDVQRMGRQPVVWDDDGLTRQRLAAAGMTFAGRPPMHDDPAENQREVCRAYQKAKFVLAHSNLVDQTNYTHKTKEYVTGRWTDALACGACVAGVQPRSDETFRDILWPEATLDFGHVDLDRNIAMLREAVAAWTPERARHNHLMALRRLDWRHSLKRIADSMSIDSASLAEELAQIDRILDGSRTPRQAVG